MIDVAIKELLLDFFKIISCHFLFFFVIEL